MESSERKLPTLDLCGMPIACVDRWQLLDHIFETMARGSGGWLVTANLDFLRRFVEDPALRELYGAGDVVTADGMPLVWAARLQGTPLPERVAGSSLVPLLAGRAEREGRSLYLFGGDAGAAARAAEVLRVRFPALQIVGVADPQVASPATQKDVDALSAELERTQPDLLLVGLGSPKQEYLIRALRARYPQIWMVGVGVSFSFLAGFIARAPVWVRRLGLEWLHRLVQEPRRLARRYLRDGFPFAFRLFFLSERKRFTQWIVPQRSIAARKRLFEERD